MKKLCAVLLSLALLLSLCSSFAFADAAEAEEPLSLHFTTTDVDGNSVTSEELFGAYDLTLVNLWETWCSPCKSELGDLERIYEELKDKGVGIVGVCMLGEAYDEYASDPDDLAELRESNGITYPLLCYTEDFAFIDTDSRPTSFFVDREGNLVLPEYTQMTQEEFDAWIESAVESAVAQAESYLEGFRSGDYDDWKDSEDPDEQETYAFFSELDERDKNGTLADYFREDVNEIYGDEPSETYGQITGSNSYEGWMDTIAEYYALATGEELEADPAEEEAPVEVLDAVPASVSAAAEKADWTVMLYLCGTDLESNYGMATSNLEDIASTRPNESVNVVVQTGGTKNWQANSFGLTVDPDKSQRYHYGSDGFVLDEELPLANMASASTLTDFVSYCAEQFPADKYLLVLWDHGGGSATGLIVDEKYNRAIMTLDQLQLGLERSGVSFEAVLLDTCLMANLETAQALQSTTHYLIASEETVPGEGSDYASWLQYLYNMPECDGRQLGRRVCDSAMQKYARLGYSYNGVTFSLIDLTQLDPVSEAFDALFAELYAQVDDPSVMLSFSYAARLTESYYYEVMLDLGDLADRARGYGVSDRTANALLSALSDAVLYNAKGVDHSYSTGLSFYYNPAGSPTVLDHYARACKSASYLAFLDRVNMKWTAPAWVYETVEQLPGITYDDYVVEFTAAVTEDGEYRLSVTNAPSAVSAADAVLFYYDEEDDTWLRLGHNALDIEGDFATGEFVATFDGLWPTLSGALCELNVTAENVDYTLYEIPVELGESTAGLVVAYEYDTPLDSSALAEGEELSYAGSYELLGIDSGLHSALPGRNTHPLSDYLGYSITPELTVVDFPSGDENGTDAAEALEVTDELSIELTELPAGTYAYAFSLTDVFGAEQLSDLASFTWDGTTAVFDYEAPVEEVEAA